MSSSKGKTMTDTPDLAPILAEFPRTTIGPDGYPRLRVQITDAQPQVIEAFDERGDPCHECLPARTYIVSFQGNGEVMFDNIQPHASFTNATLLDLAKAGQRAKVLLDQWRRSPSGQAWQEQILGEEFGWE
jgi:hypothetical protein